MGRISKALEKLRGKCTEAGHAPKGNTTADILDCIAEHYEGGGIPSVEGSGKAIVSVNGEWVEQDGYGWTERGNQTVITWDGDTEGKTAVSGVFYHVSDNIFHWDDLVGGTFVDARGNATSLTAEIVEQMKTTFQDDNNDVVLADYFACALADDAEITFEGNTFTFPKKGVYFSTAYGTGEMILTYGTPDTVHKIDEKYLPTSGGTMVVNITTEDYESWSADRSFDEISAAIKSGSVVYVSVESEGVYAQLMSFIDNQSLKAAVFASVGYSAVQGVVLTQFTIDGTDNITVESKNLSVQ